MLPVNEKQCYIVTSISLAGHIHKMIPGPLGANLSETAIEIQIFIEENAFENVVCEMSAILSRPQCVKPLSHAFFS